MHALRYTLRGKEVSPPIRDEISSDLTEVVRVLHTRMHLGNNLKAKMFSELMGGASPLL